MWVVKRLVAMGGVDRAPAGLAGLEELERHGSPAAREPGPLVTLELEALTIIEDEWRPPRRALRELTAADSEEIRNPLLGAAIRIVRAGRWPAAGVSGRWR